jgi:hypothetical protein
MDNVHELMEKSGNTPEIGGGMILAEVGGGGSQKVERKPIEMEA